MHAHVYIHVHTCCALQASAEVELSNDWFKPTTEDDAGDDGGNAQTPADGEAFPQQCVLHSFVMESPLY